MMLHCHWQQMSNREWRIGKVLNHRDIQPLIYGRSCQYTNYQFAFALWQVSKTGERKTPGSQLCRTRQFR